MDNISKEDFYKLFDTDENIFFIQIGANDGISWDPIRELVLRDNWSGILYEPGDEAFQQLLANYSNKNNLIFEKKAVSDYDGEGNLFCGTTTPHFTLSFEKAVHMFDVEPQELKVQIVSPKTIIEQYNIKKIDLLQIDAEGVDLTIIKAFPFDVIKPRVIRFEYVSIDVNEAITFLESKGYTNYIDSNDGDIISVLEPIKNISKPVIETVERGFDTNKPSIITHRYHNEMWGRAHLPFFKKFDEYLTQFFNVKSVNYNKDGNTFNGTIDLLSDKHVLGKNPPLSDVDTVIENSETGELKVISFTEYFNHYISHFAKSDICTNVLLCHFNWHNMYYWMNAENAIQHMHKIKPWIFLPFQEFDVSHYREKKNSIQNFNSKIFWMGSGIHVYRKMIKLIDEMGYMQSTDPVAHEHYLDRIINSKIGLSYYLDLDKYTTPFDHPGEFCYRDIEYIALGLPFIRVEFKDSTHDPLLPNYHYISIPREVAHVAYSKDGDKGVADLYVAKYNEVINNTAFLEYISKNQMEWYDRNLAGDAPFKLTFDLLNLKDWLNK